MTQLLFLRHASAEDFNLKSDFERRLTNKGFNESKKIAKFCVKNKIFPSKILTSPVIRAVETSKAFRKEFEQKPDIEKVEWLKSNINIKELYNNSIRLLEELFNPIQTIKR